MHCRQGLQGCFQLYICEFSMLGLFVSSNSQAVLVWADSTVNGQGCTYGRRQNAPKRKLLPVSGTALTDLQKAGCMGRSAGSPAGGGLALRALPSQSGVCSLHVASLHMQRAAEGCGPIAGCAFGSMCAAVLDACPQAVRVRGHPESRPLQQLLS